MENLHLIYEACKTSYTKPKQFKEHNDSKPNVFYRMSLTYCDRYRRTKENKALQNLSMIANTLGHRPNY